MEKQLQHLMQNALAIVFEQQWVELSRSILHNMAFDHGQNRQEHDRVCHQPH